MNGNSFPDGFLWGCATAAHQVEGGNTNNNWWAWENQPGRIRDGSTSLVACDHWNRYEEDYRLARELGHNAARISIEWSRVEPEEGAWDAGAVDHYRRMLECLHENGLRPLVTLHHFTHPLWLEERGGWLSSDAPSLLGRYAGRIAKELGPLVPVWFTINEPMIVAMMGYLAGIHPPGERDLEKFLLVGAAMLEAHARMFHAIKEASPETPAGPVLNMPYVEPQDPESSEDREAAALFDVYRNEVFLAGLETGAVIPPFGHGEEIPGLRDSWDLVGVNYYSREIIRAGSRGPRPAPPPPGAEITAFGWEVFPEGLRRCLLRLQPYGKPVYVTENGISAIDDHQRSRYVLRHLVAVKQAIDEGVDVRGYLHWTFTDNFEWGEGYLQKFGLVAVEEGTLARQPRQTAYVFQQVAEANALPADLLRAHGVQPL